jgi:hypothetical protein
MSRAGGAAAVAVAVLLVTTPVVAGMALADPTAANPSRTASTQSVGVPADSPPVAEADRPSGVSPQLLPENESTAPHDNPDEVAERGDLTTVKRWLVGRAGRILLACARRGTVETPTNGTCAPLTSGERYRSLVSRYATVADATESSRDDGVSARLSQAGDRQVEFVRTVVTYRATLAAYRNATRQNQSRRAIALTRRVSVLAAEIQTVGGQLQNDYDAIEGAGPASLGPARQIVSNTTQNASETADRLRSSEFTTPTLTLSASRTNVSFTESATLTGQLRTQQGEPLSDRVVVIETPEGQTRLRTDENGTFEAPYRPTATPVGNATVVARYLPRNDAVYLPAETETVVAVQPTRGTLRLTNVTSTVGFGDPLRVQGVVAVNGTPAPGVPFAVVLDGQTLTTNATNETGRVNVTTRIPADAPASNLTLAVEPAADGRALTTAPASTTVEVRQTTPRLVVGSERLEADTVRLFGRLSAGGVGVPDARLQFRHRGESVSVVRVDETGAFETNVTLGDVAPDESTAMTVVYAPAEGNLDPLELQVRVQSVPRGLPDTGGVRETVLTLLAPFLRLDPTLLGVGALAALAVFLVATAAARPGSGLGLRSLWPLGGRDAGESGGAGADDIAAAAESDAAGASRPSLLDLARASLDDGRPDDAVVVAYSAVREHLDRRIANADPSLTHWELLVVVRDALDDERRAALERLTATYESAAFSPGSNTAETAREALDSAAALTDDSNGSERT